MDIKSSQLYRLDAEYMANENVQRSKDRKKRRSECKDLVTSKNGMGFLKQCMENHSYGELAKCLLTKMLGVGMIDNCTSPQVILCIAENANELFTVSHQCRDGNGFELVKSCVDPARYPAIMEALRANYSSLHDPEDKCLFWTLCGAFLIIHYEVHSDLVFQIPLVYEEVDYANFLRRYPEFLIRTWDSASLLTFQLCMKRAVQCFGNGNNMGCLVELVTRMVKGRDVALTCNTSGGGLRNYDHPTEVSTEKCRILIYQRESGILPRTRKSRGSKRKYVQTGPLSSVKMPVIPGINAPRGGGERLDREVSSPYATAETASYAPPSETYNPPPYYPQQSTAAAAQSQGPMYQQGPPSHLGPRGTYDTHLLQGGMPQSQYPHNYGMYDTGGYPGPMYGQMMGGVYGAPMSMGAPVDNTYMHMESDYFSYKPTGIMSGTPGESRPPPNMNPPYDYNNRYMYGNPPPHNMQGSMGYR